MAHLLLETGTDVLLNENGLDGYMLEDGYTSVIDLDAPVAHWRLGETSGTVAVDRVGGRNGEYVNTPTLGATGALAGDTDTAVTFVNASAEYVDIPVSSVWQVATTGELSIEFWANLATAAGTNFEYVITNAFISGGTQQNGFVIQVNDSSGQYFLQIYGRNAGSQVTSTRTADTTYNVWHHFVATIDHSPRDARWYVDGLLSGVPDTPSADIQDNTTANLRFGEFDANATRYLDGTLDEVAFYPTVLTASKVLAHYVAGIARRPQDARVNRQAVTRAANF